MERLIERLAECHSLAKEEYRQLIAGYSEASAKLLREYAVAARRSVYGNAVYIRGLIEFTNICRNDCYYCGIRKSNLDVNRYRLDEDEILSCCASGYELGFRTFVLQGGEDGYYDDDRLCRIVKMIRRQYPDCAITLSVGERERDSLEALFAAGANRYLLRHETADRTHYESLHPTSMSYDHRMECLYHLREIGYQVGCGFMVGSPGQTVETLAKDLKFIEEFQPQMCGIGPFIPHRSTVYADHSAGTVEMTCYLLSIIRLIKPNILLPATTALGTVCKDGRRLGILSGANVVMPNLSPKERRGDYELYDNKIHTGTEDAFGVRALAEDVKSIGYEIVSCRGDIINKEKEG